MSLQRKLPIRLPQGKLKSPPIHNMTPRKISLAAFRLWQRLEKDEADAKFIEPDLFPTKERDAKYIRSN